MFGPWRGRTDSQHSNALYPTVVSTHGEDSQPNEIIAHKRRQPAPPQVRPAGDFNRGHGNGLPLLGRGSRSFSFGQQRHEKPAGGPQQQARSSSSASIRLDLRTLAGIKPSHTKRPPYRSFSTETQTRQARGNASILPHPVKRRKVDPPIGSPRAASGTSQPAGRHVPIVTSSSSAIPHLSTPASSIPSSVRRTESLPNVKQTSPKAAAHRVSATGHSSLPSSSPPKKFKRERSPSPDMPPMRHLTKSGTRRYHPLPANCRKTHPDCEKNRKAWIYKEGKALRALGPFTIERVLIRTDGMVMDWTSPTPVWSDTLRAPTPNTLSDLADTIVRAHTANELSSQKYRRRKKRKPLTSSLCSTASTEVIDVDELDDDLASSPLTGKSSAPSSPLTPTPRMPKPPRPATVQNTVPRVEERPRTPPTHGQAPAGQLKPEPSQTPSSSVVQNAHPAYRDTDNIRDDKKHSPSSSDVVYEWQASGTPVTTPSATDSSLAIRLEVEEMENQALEYLERYIQTFDTNRSALGDAYSHRAIFSYRVHDVITRPPSQSSTTKVKTEAESETFAPRSESRTTSNIVYQGRRPITSALLSLGLLKFSPDVDYDLYWLGREEGILLVGYGKMCGVKMEDGGDFIAFGVEQSWVLRKREGEGKADDMDVDGVWPLVAVAHQMVVRDLNRAPS